MRWHKLGYLRRYEEASKTTVLALASQARVAREGSELLWRRLPLFTFEKQKCYDNDFTSHRNDLGSMSIAEFVGRHGRSYG